MPESDTDLRARAREITENCSGDALTERIASALIQQRDHIFNSFKAAADECTKDTQGREERRYKAAMLTYQLRKKYPDEPLLQALADVLARGHRDGIFHSEVPVEHGARDIKSIPPGSEREKWELIFAAMKEKAPEKLEEIAQKLEEPGFPHIAARLREEKDKPSATTGLGLEDNTGRS